MWMMPLHLHVYQKSQYNIMIYEVDNYANAVQYMGSTRHCCISNYLIINNLLYTIVLPRQYCTDDRSHKNLLFNLLIIALHKCCSGELKKELLILTKLFAILVVIYKTAHKCFLDLISDRWCLLY